ncbi:hypothetical protein PHLGIDRAFT_17204 [Phlebiopsis gigantea 11061_1 CR5-6]|uniref:Uncharacterized protein n=1 Tax=Phlebiopsis gigantea (strain 11061_1 CR5-6) TaxID=745531 RepID=A0A0C3NAB6_PHLG1|nr:hypothetical protein PHLGIDRAFT_17204 [Phlebiopsis gigantea 11061_1 CR5-6]
MTEVVPKASQKYDIGKICIGRMLHALALTVLNQAGANELILCLQTTLLQHDNNHWQSLHKTVHSVFNWDDSGGSLLKNMFQANFLVVHKFFEKFAAIEAIVAQNFYLKAMLPRMEQALSLRQSACGREPTLVEEQSHDNPSVCIATRASLPVSIVLFKAEPEVNSKKKKPTKVIELKSSNNEEDLFDVGETNEKDIKECQSKAALQKRSKRLTAAKRKELLDDDKKQGNLLSYGPGFIKCRCGITIILDGSVRPMKKLVKGDEAPPKREYNLTKPVMLLKRGWTANIALLIQKTSNPKQKLAVNISLLKPALKPAGVIPHPNKDGKMPCMRHQDNRGCYISTKLTSPYHQIVEAEGKDAQLPVDKHAKVEARQISNILNVLLQSQYESVKELLKDERVLKAYCQLEDGNVGQVFLDLFEHVSHNRGLADAEWDLAVFSGQMKFQARSLPKSLLYYRQLLPIHEAYHNVSAPILAPLVTDNDIEDDNNDISEGGIHPKATIDVDSDGPTHTNNVINCWEPEEEAVIPPCPTCKTRPIAAFCSYHDLYPLKDISVVGRGQGVRAALQLENIFERTFLANNSPLV